MAKQKQDINLRMVQVFDLIIAGLLTATVAMVVPLKPAQATARLVQPIRPIAKASPVLARVVLPGALIAARAQGIVDDLMRRPLRQFDGSENLQGAHINTVQASPSKGAWLETIYTAKMVESSWATEMLSDKRLFAEVLRRELGDKANSFYPKTLGLREFLVKRNLLDSKGEIAVTGDVIEAALQEEFPAGFIIRPAVGVAPGETDRGLFPDGDQFIVELLKPGNVLYSPAHYFHPVKSHILDAVASGEAVVLQENVVSASDARKKLKTRSFQEVRIHTYENRIVQDAVPVRWVQNNVLSKSQVRATEAFVSGFLMNLPLPLMTRQAWGIDVAVMDNGEMRVIDVVTNRGKAIAWSSYLDQPKIIAAYSRHFEDFYGLRFTGINGALIRHGFANYLPFWEKRIEMAKPGFGKMIAYLPPMP